MFKKFKVSISFLIMTVFLIINPITALAAENTAAAMDLDTVMKNTVSSNSALSLYDKKIETATAAEEDATNDPGDETDYQTEMRLSVNPQRRQLELDNLNWEKDQKQDSVTTDSKQYYYGYLIQEELIKIQQSKIERLKKVLENKKLGIDVGTEAQTSLIDDQVNLDTAEVGLEQLSNDKESLRMKLNINMGKDVDTAINLKSEDIPYEEYTVEDIGALAKNMSEEYHSITSLNRELELDKVEKGIAEIYDDDKNQLERAGSPNTDYKSYAETLGDDITNLEYAVIDEQNAINAKVRTDYNNLLNLNNTVLSKKLDYDQAQILYNSEKAKFSVGMSTKLSCDAAEENMKAATCEYNKAKLDYLVSVEQFKSYVKDFI